jgi:thiol-disulfide isomerase/thioredoxin
LGVLALRLPTVADLTKDTFSMFSSSEVGIAVVHFFGKNCHACTAAEDTFEELSRMLPGQSHLKKSNRYIDTDSFERCSATRGNLLSTNKSDFNPLLRKPFILSSRGLQRQL